MAQTKAQKEAAKVARAAKKLADKKITDAQVAKTKAEVNHDRTVTAEAGKMAAKAVEKAAGDPNQANVVLEQEIARLKAENIKILQQNKELSEGITKKDFDELELQAKEIANKAIEINTAYEALVTPEERAAFVRSLEAELGVAGFITNHFTIGANDPDTPAAAPVAPAADLPLSEIISNLPVRVIEQRLYNTLQEYTLGKFIDIENVRNGMLQIFYGDYLRTDNKKAYDDVTIADFNGVTTPAGTELFQVDTDIHTTFKILDSALNDVTVSMGLFLSIVSSSLNGFTKPVARTMYTRFATFLDQAANYDETIDFAVGATTVDKAKQFARKLFTLSTTSRTHLKKIPNGLTDQLEYKIPMDNTVVVMNANYAADYKFDLAASTFQLAEITYKVKEIIVLDFDMIQEYIDTPTDHLKKLEILMFEDGVYKEIRHYTGTKTVPTAKFFTIFHWYSRIANLRRKDKILIGFKQGV